MAWSWPFAWRRCTGRVGSIRDRPELSARGLAGFLAGNNQLNKDMAGFLRAHKRREAQVDFRWRYGVSVVVRCANVVNFFA